MFIYLLFMSLIVIMLYFLVKSIQSKKNIWQKISFLYNKLYLILVMDLYNSKANNKLKQEVLSFYKRIVKIQNLWQKIKEWKKTESFIKWYYNNKYNLDLLYKNIDSLVSIYYNSVLHNINLLIFILSVCIIVFIITLIY